MSVLEELRSLEGVRANAGASDAALSAVSEFFGVALPDDLLRLWRRSNGLVIEAADAEILGSDAILDFMASAPFAEKLRELGWLPLIDEHTSNYLCLALKPPLAPRMVELPHDDGPLLKYQDLEAGLRALLASVQAGVTFDLYRHEADDDFTDANRPRSPQDQADARALLATDGEDHQWNFAIQLLDAGNLDEFARLLETEHFVRRDARARMERMSAPEIRKVLGRDRMAFEGFAQAIAVAAIAAGFKVAPAEAGTVLRIGRCYIELEAFFHRRKEPGAMDSFVARIKHLNELNDKRA
jgi:hypothetical protein